MKPAANISVDVPEPIQPKKTGAFVFEKLRQFKNKVAAGTIAVLGLASSAEAIDAGIYIGSLPANQTTTNKSNATQHVEGVTSNTIHIPYAPNGGELTVGINWQIDSTQLGGDINSTVDLGFSLERRFNGGTPVTLVDTNPIPALPRTTIGLSSDTYDRSGTLYDTWSIGPVTDPAGIDIPLIYTGITDSRLEGSQANFGGAIPGSHSSPISVYFTPNLLNPDINTNSIPDNWEMTHFGMLAPADADPDHDGVNNLLEYAFNTDPLVPNKIPMTYSFETVGSDKYLCITYPKNPTANLTYTGETSSDLIHWTSDAVTIPMSATSEKVRDTIPVSSSPKKRFIRLKISSNP